MRPWKRPLDELLRLVREERRVEPALDIVLCHQERWDGNGYPRGLAGENIPLLLFMGLTDVLVPYSGAAPSFAAWRDENGCDSAGPHRRSLRPTA